VIPPDMSFHPSSPTAEQPQSSTSPPLHRRPWPAASACSRSVSPAQTLQAAPATTSQEGSPVWGGASRARLPADLHARACAARPSAHLSNRPLLVGGVG